MQPERGGARRQRPRLRPRPTLARGLRRLRRDHPPDPERADTLLADLAPGDDAPPELRRTRAAALNEFATTYLTQGDLDAAQAAAEQSRDIIAKLAAADPGNAEWQRDLSVSWNKLGDVRMPRATCRRPQAYTEQEHRDSSPPPTPATPSGSATSRS